MSTNPITGDPLRSKPLSQEGKDNWDLIFGPPKPKTKAERFWNYETIEMGFVIEPDKGEEKSKS